VTGRDAQRAGQGGLSQPALLAEAPEADAHARLGGRHQPPSRRRRCSQTLQNRCSATTNLHTSRPYQSAGFPCILLRYVASRAQPRTCAAAGHLRRPQGAPIPTASGCGVRERRQPEGEHVGDAIPGLDQAPTAHRGLISWVSEIAALARPSRVHWCDGSQEEWEDLTGLLVK